MTEKRRNSWRTETYDPGYDQAKQNETYDNVKCIMKTKLHQCKTYDLSFLQRKKYIFLESLRASLCSK